MLSLSLHTMQPKNQTASREGCGFDRAIWVHEWGL
jgi:hypothetical protein